jgi:hypothetical protein
MEIKLDYYEIMEAIEAHLLSVYDVKLDIDSMIECPRIRISEMVYVYDEDAQGKKEVNWDKSKPETNHYGFGEGDELSFWVTR